MNFKNTNNLILLFFLLFFLISCSKENNEKLIIELEKNNISHSDYIKEEIIYKSDETVWNNSLKLKKIMDISFGKKSNIIINSPSNLKILDNFIYYVDYKANFIKLDLDTRKKVFKIKIKENLDSNITLPTFIDHFNNFYYVAFGNGTIIKINEKGEKYWEKNFNDLIRTPIKIINENVVILFNSNKIISINSDDGSIMWEFQHELNKPSLSDGGKILDQYNLVYFIMPNGRIGVVDTIIGEQLKNNFLNELTQKNILNYSYEVKMSIYDNLFSVIEDNNIFYTYDIENEKFLFFNEKMFSLKSISFNNNCLFALQEDLILKVYNIKNKDIFWEINLSKHLSKKDTIVKSFIFKDTIVIMFSTGKIIQFNKSDGEISFKQDLNLSDIVSIIVNDNYFVFNQNNGRSFFYSQ